MPLNWNRPPFTATVPVKPELTLFMFRFPMLPVFMTSEPVPVNNPENTVFALWLSAKVLLPTATIPRS